MVTITKHRQSPIDNRKFWKGSLTGKAVVLKTTAHCRWQVRLLSLPPTLLPIADLYEGINSSQVKGQSKIGNWQSAMTGGFESLREYHSTLPICLGNQFLSGQRPIENRQLAIGNDWAIKNRKCSRGCSLVGSKRCTVDAEIASSSLVSPASKRTNWKLEIGNWKSQITRVSSQIGSGTCLLSREL